jgi:hypothetical protein
MASTEFHSEWDGAGSISHSFDAGDDADVWMSTSGNKIVGEFDAKDMQNDPYGYGVDGVSANVDAMVYHGGEISFNFERTDSHPSMYGPAGQESNTYVWSNGYAGITYRSSSNFAAMKNCEYGFQSNKQMIAGGSEFGISHDLRDADDEGASVSVWGEDGEASVTSMSEEAGGSGFKFGKGCGCYTNCGVNAEGKGQTVISSNASNHLKGDGWEMPNGGSHTETWTYNGGVDVNESDFWSEGH